MKRITNTTTIAQVQTAIAITQKEKNDIAEFIKSTGFTGDIVYSVHEDILGGIRIEVGDWVYDTSLKEQLKKLVTTLS